MMSGHRYRRPRLDRTNPLRTWNHLYVPRNDDKSAPHATPTSTPEPAPDAAPNAIAQGVAAGYRVIEAYLTQGEAYARSVARAGPNPAATPDPRRLSERMVQHASALASAWLEYVQASVAPVVPGAAPVAPRSPTSAREIPDVGPFAIPHRAPRHAPVSADPQASQHVTQPLTQPTSAEPAPRRASALRVVVDLTSARRSASQVELFDVPTPLRVRAHTLRHEQDRSQRLEGLVVELHAPRLLLRVTIPAGASAGAYRAALLDVDRNVPFGTLTLEVFD